MSLETARLNLRAITLEDAEDLFEIFGNPELMQYWLQGADKTIEQTIKWIQYNQEHRALHQFGDWAVVEKTTNELIGTCGLLPLLGMHEPDLGYVIAKSKQGAGFATEAVRAVIQYGFQVLNLCLIGAATDPRNIASQKVLIKAGFSFHGKGGRRGQPRLNYVIVDSRPLIERDLGPCSSSP